jgi:hypothetical protein
VTLTRRDAVCGIAGIALGGMGVAAWLRGSKPETHDVRSFGARGDGLSDDADAIQRAIDSTQSELWFPAGQYKLGRSLRPRSGQSWRGEGALRSILVFGGSPTQESFNLVHTIGSVSDFSLRDLGFVGGRSRQLVASRSGQVGFGIYLRGALSAVAIRGCRFESFGDGRSGGGGIVLGAVPGQNEQGLSDILVEGCSFFDNGNVPGLYISGGDRPGVERSGIRISGNTFAGTGGSNTVQNAVYILGGTNAAIRHVEVASNRFEFSTPVDAAIELNWVESFTISKNTLHFHATMPGSTGMLIRDGSHNGTISENSITSDTPEASLRGILLLNFSHPDRISNIVVSGNILSGVAGAIAADRGTSGVVIANNRIHGGSEPGSFGVRIADAAEVMVSGNLITFMRNAVTLGHGDQAASDLRGILVEGNYIRECGGQGLYLIAALLAGPAKGSDVTIRGNHVYAVQPGSAGLIAPELVSMSAPGNIAPITSYSP